MRVAVHFPDGSVAAYKLGRIEDGVHNIDILTGEHTPIDEFVNRLAERAQKENPDCTVSVQRMVLKQEAEEESEWIHHKEFDPEKHEPAPPGGLIQPVGVGTNATTKGSVTAGKRKEE